MAAISSLIALGTAAAGAYTANRQASAANRSADAQTALAQEQAALAREQWNYYKDNYQPLEKGLISDAQNYDTAGRREEMATRAMADQQREWDAGRQQLTNRFASMGLNPADGRFQSGLEQMDVQAAAAKAGAGTLARRAVETEGYNRRLAVANLGRGLPAQASGAMTAAIGGLGNAAQLQAQLAARNAQGIGYLGGKLGDAFASWFNRQQTPGDYNSGVWGLNGPGE